MPKKSIKHHIIHKTKLSLFLILKIFLVFLIFYAIMLFFAMLYPLINFDELNFMNIFLWSVGLAIATILYLVFIIKALHIFRFQ